MGIIDKKPSVPNCRAGKDGDCSWDKCPQLRDDEPKATGRHCPNDTAWEDYYMRTTGDPEGAC